MYIILHEPITGQAGHGRGKFLGQDDSCDIALRPSTVYMNYIYLWSVPIFSRVVWSTKRITPYIFWALLSTFYPTPTSNLWAYSPSISIGYPPPLFSIGYPLLFSNGFPPPLFSVGFPPPLFSIEFPHPLFSFGFTLPLFSIGFPHPLHSVGLLLPLFSLGVPPPVYPRPPQFYGPLYLYWAPHPYLFSIGYPPFSIFIT